MLDIKERQTYLKALGFYTGKIDGIEGQKTKKAYKDLQEKYFNRASDIDGIYGKDTNILLINAYNVATYTKNFKLTEFKCQCSGNCTGYPVKIDIQLLKNLQAMRDKYGALEISSGMRCKVHNANVGGVSNSRHTTGKAVDTRNSKTASLAVRKDMINYWYKLKGSRYAYCNVNGNYPNMGTSIHIDVN